MFMYTKGAQRLLHFCFKIHTIDNVYGTVLNDILLVCGKLLVT